MARARGERKAEQARRQGPGRDTLSWSTPVEGLTLFCRGVTVRTASRVALVVGTVLSAVNQGSVILGGEATAATWLRVAVNYAVPFLVSSFGFLAACRSDARK